MFYKFNNTFRIFVSEYKGVKAMVVYMWRIDRLYMVLALMFLFASCRQEKAVECKGGIPMCFDYARLIEVVFYDGYTVAEIRNPWDSAGILHRYVLLDREKAVPDSLPEGTLLRIPLQNVVISSVVYCTLWKDLHAENTVKGICDTRYLMSPYWRQAIERHEVQDVGSSMNVDVEKLIALRCDGILMSPFNKGSYGALEKTDIPIIECADYMETSPLARAEWMRFYGLLTGGEQQADSLFRQVEEEYLSLKARVADAKSRPTVFMDIMSSNTWYQPGANSTIGQLVADAGGRYLFSDYSRQGSVPLSFETVLRRAQNADIWLIRANSLTYSSMAENDERYTFFETWKNRHIWLCDLSRVPFFEETPFQPQRLLADFIKIMHPEIIEGETMYFTAMP